MPVQPSRHAPARSLRESALLTPELEAHAVAVLEALAPWTGGHRIPKFTFDAAQPVDAYAERTLARLRRAICTYDPHRVIAVAHALAAYRQPGWAWRRPGKELR